MMFIMSGAESYSVADGGNMYEVTGIVKPYQGEKRIREGEINDVELTSQRLRRS